MRAQVLRQYGEPLVAETVPDPVPGPGDVVVRVRASGICGTDLKITSGKLPHVIRLPHVPGHEIAGEIAAVGSAVRDLSPGARGIVYHYLPCRDCPACRTGRENVCHAIVRLGFELPGGFAEYVKVPAYNFCRCEADLSLDALAILPDAVLTAYHSVTSCGDLRGGQRIGVVGAGGLGLHAVQVARLLGGAVAVADARPEALEAARSLGADRLVNPAAEDVVAAVMEWTHGDKVDVVLEGTGSAQLFQGGLEVLAPGGRLVIMGYDPLSPYPLKSMAMHYNEWTIAGSRLGTKQELLEVLDLVTRGRIRPVVGRTLPFDQVNRGLAEVRSGAVVGRVVLSMA